MSAFMLEWGGTAVSLFNTIILLWLGFTVILNAERRTWGIWLAGGSLLMGGAFFAWHSAVLRYRIDYIVQHGFWWTLGWIPVTLLPLAWYIVTLSYAGYWERPASQLHKRHRPWFIAVVCLAVIVAGLIVFSDFSPLLVRSSRRSLTTRLHLGDAPIQLMAYPLYLILSISLSLDALARPEPSGRMMGDVARRRARPWLMATAVMQLVVSLMVVGVMVWIVTNIAPWVRFDAKLSVLSQRLAVFDIIIASLLALATIFAGQAIVSYEIFTGHALPRRGITRHWRRAIILAAGFGIVAGLGSSFHIGAIYGLLLTTILMVLFYALLGWRSYGERERHMQSLRPFVASQQLYAHVLTGNASEPSDVDVATPFRALCSEVLGAGSAGLYPLGSLASLSGAPLTYPNGSSPSLPWLAEITPSFRSPSTLCFPLEPATHNGYIWAVPLWGERGLIGVLLLGEKRDGSLYTEEEIEIARTVGERLIDTQSSAELARQLMALQRQRLAESRVLDQQTRRTLHDDILPQIHAAMLALGSGASNEESVTLLTDAHRRISTLLREMPASPGMQVERQGVIVALRQMVERELAGSFDAVQWRISPAAEGHVHDVSTMAAEIAFYAAREAMRNAARHGRGGDAQRPLHLTLEVTWSGGLRILIEDDGVGLAAEGSSGGSGQGLAMHGTMMAVVGGSLETESVTGRYTRVVLVVPEALTPALSQGERE